MKNRSLYLMMLASLLVSSCGDKPKENNIIAVKQPKSAAAKQVQKVGDYQQTRQVQWVGNVYSVDVKRAADPQLPLVDDGTGNKYYDNSITVRVLRKDGSEFFAKTFTKADFDAYLDKEYKKNSALLGVVLDKAEGDYLYFAASVGSPDKLSDEFVPLVVKLSRMGQIFISKDTMLDTDSGVRPSGESQPLENEPEDDYEDEGV